MAASQGTSSDDANARDDTKQRTVWITIVLVLVIVFSGISFWALRSMENPSSAAIVTALGFALVAIVLAPLMFEISELSISEGKITAKIQREIRPVVEKVDNLRKEVLAKLEGQYEIATYKRRSERYRDLWRMLEPLAFTSGKSR
jgi:heme/copper-type cytochrome/quinol oxidase subunit 4